MTLPNFLGIGAPKSGTTWLSRCLGEHPDVFMPAAKELVFFDYGDFDQRMADYQAHFSAVAGESAIGEFTTRYLASPRPAPRIAEMIPHARLIVCLRNPADQIYSHYWHLARQNWHQASIQPEVAFEQALEKYEDLLKRPARYWDHFQYWLQFFPREQFLILLYDDILCRPHDVIREAYAFLGVDAAFRPGSARSQGSAERKGTSPRSATAKKVHARLYAALTRNVYLPLKRAIGVRRADRIKESLRIRHVLESLFFRQGYPELASSTRRRLNDEFRDQVAGIEQLLGRRLQSWK